MSKDSHIIKRVAKKAAQSGCRFLIAAMGFNRKGQVVIIKTNRSRFDRLGGGIHAEIQVMRLAKRYGIVEILIGRVGRAGVLRPIEPCENCLKVANKLGIKINSIYYGEKND